MRTPALTFTLFASESFDCIWRCDCRRRRHRCPGLGGIHLLIGWFAGEATVPVLEVASRLVIWTMVAFALTIDQDVVGHQSW